MRSQQHATTPFAPCKQTGQIAKAGGVFKIHFYAFGPCVLVLRYVRGNQVPPESQTKSLPPLELESQGLVSCQVGAENRTPVL